jgi:CheY-like chemotaxis protein
LALVVAQAVSGFARAQDDQSAPSEQKQAPILNAGELDQLAAPIALYPDTLLAQVLIASTYPLEVVQADRFAKANKGLKGDKLTQALDKKDWDASVKQLVSTPTVLAMMSEQLDWGLDGIETSKRILALPDLSIAPNLVMVTAYGREDVLKQADENGLENVLIKPVTSSTLFDTIVAVLHARQEPSSHVETTPSFEIAQTRGTRVLLVEDNEINQEVAIGLLEDAAIQVDLAENGEIAVRMAGETRYDAVLMDMQMPVMDGIEATRVIRSDPRLQDLPIIAMTANAMANDREQCLKAGMNDHIGKPIDPDELFSVLLRWARPGAVEVAREPSLGS